MEDFTENSKLIASFMGQLTKENNVDFGDKPFDGYCLHRVEKARYHESWDWLMPVYHRIQDTIGETSPLFKELFHGIILFNNIRFLYETVLLFIEINNRKF